MTVPATNRVGYKEILATLLLKTIPLIVVATIVYKYVNENVEMNQFASTTFYFAFLVGLFFIVRWTAWKMLQQLIREANEDLK
jgi:hypothetical protein